MFREFTAKEERAIIKCGRDSTSFTDWEALADQLKTGRTPVQLFSRYQSSLNPKMIKKRWTKEEDAALIAALEKYGDGNWTAMCGESVLSCCFRAAACARGGGDQTVAAAAQLTPLHRVAPIPDWACPSPDLTGRTGMQLLHRWENTVKPRLNPKMRQGKWTVEEKEQLQAGVAGAFFARQTRALLATVYMKYPSRKGVTPGRKWSGADCEAAPAARCAPSAQLSAVSLPLGQIWDPQLGEHRQDGAIPDTGAVPRALRECARHQPQKR